MPRLNVPYVTTIVLDYCWMATYWIGAYLFARDDKLNAFTGALCILYVDASLALREQIYSVLFKRHFAKVKTNFSMSQHPDYWIDVASTSFIVLAMAFVGCWYNLMHCSFHNGNLVQVALQVSMDFWLVNIMKDNTSMRFAHPWMHKRENYWIHKRHHQGNKNLCTVPGAYLFSFLDLLAEFGVGPILGLLFKCYVLKTDPSLHLLAFAFSLWTDGNVHSLNPYTQAIGNPILDHLMKPTIVHNLHHAFERDPKYMMVYPMHHFFSKEEREYDVKVYNKIMKTNICFEVFR